MLELYRASAGSGKTYTLAKKYLWYFLTIRPEGEEERLRTDNELTDSARHILAVTFTNKATNEMQQRIVKALYDLATIRTKTKTLPDGSTKVILPDYMEDFCDSLHVTQQQLAHAAAVGLSTLLENYSDFNVSTIDSFFQTVLRTFAYESELNDTYQVEIDNEFLSQLGVDATLEEIDANQKDSATPFWIRTLMDRARRRWNMFARTITTRSNSENPYKEFIDSVRKLDNEEYKGIRDEIEDYFKEYGHRLPELYNDFTERYDAPAKKAFLDLMQVARKAMNALPADLKGLKGNATLGKFQMFYRKILGKTSNDFNLKWDTLPQADPTPTWPSTLFGHKKWHEWEGAYPEGAVQVKEHLDKVTEALGNWLRLVGDEEFIHWQIYADNLPFYALFSTVGRKRQEYLDENNTVELGETSMILNKVISDSDTPFVYERLGTRLNHFLIDEFQDTSKMQWRNLNPLLRESISTGHGNLIIGDAKQSIYRFRNADPSLISDVVPAEFSGAVDIRGNVPSENTNYRSELRIVQFNNSFFDFLVADLDSRTEAIDPARMMFKPLYGNVMQTPFKRKSAGYVEVDVIPTQDKRRSDYVPYDPPRVERVPLLIKSLLDRGYQQREIAVLVSRNSEGEEIIKEFTRYNNECGEGDRKIRFVSEQSLKVASSRAVQVVVGVLSNMARGSNPVIPDVEERKEKGVQNWRELEANFKYYQLEHFNQDVATTLEDFLSDGTQFNALSDMLRNMQSLSIPAVVEAVCSTFLHDLSETDAVYIAAFQDLVLEYCESHPTDIGSFLSWWDRKSRNASISSPEDVDAVQVLTVHKSKGLQYDCVILPFADWDFSDSTSKSEWRWVEPKVISHPEIPLPPYMPVSTGPELRRTNHAELYTDYIDQVHMDSLNAAYVAFTRAKQELYIFAKGNYKADDVKIGEVLKEFLTIASQEALPPDRSGADLALTSDVTIISERPFKATVGSPTPAKEIGKDRESKVDPIVIDSYKSVKDPKLPRFRAEVLKELADASEKEKAKSGELDIRTEGTLKHAVMEYVNVPEDLPDAVRHLILTGLLPDSLAESIESDLREALARPEVAKWFDGTARVLNERPVLKRGEMPRRPDRLLVYPDGTAVVVDYKFGKVPEDNKHINQIKRYVRLLRETGRFPRVDGYLWYVNENAIIEV